MAKKTTSDVEFQPVVLVTGCSSGIGLALADLLYKEPHYRVIATARAASLESLKIRFQESDRFWVRQLDVTREAERNDLIREISLAWRGVASTF